MVLQERVMQQELEDKSGRMRFTDYKIALDPLGVDESDADGTSDTPAYEADEP